VECRLSQNIRIENIDILKGAKINLLNRWESASHPTFEMVNKQDYNNNKGHIPIWKISNSYLIKDTNISGVMCQKASYVEITDNAKLVKCANAKSTTLEGFKVADGCSVSNINPLQSKENRLDVWEYSCLNVKVAKKRFSLFHIRYFPDEDRILKMSASISYKKHTLEDLLKKDENDTH